MVCDPSDSAKGRILFSQLLLKPPECGERSRDQKAFLPAFLNFIFYCISTQ